MPMPYIYYIRQEQGLRRYLPPYSLFPSNAPKLLKQDHYNSHRTDTEIL